MFVLTTAVAETVGPACLIAEVQFLKTQIECPSYLDNQFVSLFGFMGISVHLSPHAFWRIVPLRELWCQFKILLHHVESYE
jgi:hypothetical protein